LYLPACFGPVIFRVRHEAERENSLPVELERRTMKSKTKLTFAELPRDYPGLCGVLAPRSIHDKADYENTLEVAAVMAGFETSMSKDQDDYFDTLCTLIEAYEAQHVHWKKAPPLRVLKEILEEKGMNGVDLSHILGASRNLGAMILRGVRRITADHARTLAAHFKVSPELFLEAPEAPKQKRSRK
jgi:HTH-type transcriptional regulator / antitoxin HigA